MKCPFFKLEQRILLIVEAFIRQDYFKGNWKIENLMIISVGTASSQAKQCIFGIFFNPVVWIWGSES